MMREGVDAMTAIADLGLEQITDPEALRAVVQGVVDGNPKPAADYRAGVTKALHALKGLVMRETKGKADPDQHQWRRLQEQLADAVKGRDRLDEKDVEGNQRIAP